MKTEKEKAEAYVRSKCPELMELSFGCEVFLKDNTPPLLFKVIYKDSKTVGLSSGVSAFYTGINAVKIIGHAIQLQHWLRVLSNLHNFRSITFHIEDNVWEVNLRKNVDGIEFEHLKFNLTTGQPATESDYQAFNQIVGI